MARELSNRARELITTSRRFRCPRDPEVVRRRLRQLEFELSASILEFQEALGGVTYFLCGEQVTWGLWAWRKGSLWHRLIEPSVEVVQGKRYLFCGDYLAPMERYLGEDGRVYGGLGEALELLAESPWHLLESDALEVAAQVSNWEVLRVDGISIEPAEQALARRMKRADDACGSLHRWWEAEGVWVRSHQSCSFCEAHAVAYRTQEADAAFWTEVVLDLRQRAD